MENTMNSHSAAAINSANSNINNYKFYRLSGGHNFADLAGAVEEMRDINGAIGVRDHEGIRIFVRREEGMWTLTMFNLVGIGTASHEEKYNLGQRMTTNMIKKIESLVLAFIDTIADFEYEQEIEQQEQQTDKMMEIVAEAQETIDHLVMDLQSIARTRDEIKTKMDAFAASKIVEKINDICAQCLVDCGGVCGCSMGADDGFFPNLANLDCWMSGLDPDVYLMTDVDVDFDYWLGLLDYENSDMPLGFDEEQVRFDIEGEVDDFIDLVCHYPHYLWDTMRDYISTNFHYSYCA